VAPTGGRANDDPPGPYDRAEVLLGFLIGGLVVLIVRGVVWRNQRRATT
jgi:hypothetical protein